MSERLVIIGGDAAGMSAASQARRRRGPDDLEIVAFERGNHSSYSACGIPYYVAALVDDSRELIARTPEEFEARDIEVRLRHEVTEIDPDRGFVTVRNLQSGGEHREPFDHLVVATGASPIRPPLPGIDAEGVQGVQTLDDGIHLRALADGGGSRRVVVVGGGYIGLEMAEAYVHRDWDVTLVEAASQPMSTLDTDMCRLVADAIEQVGVTLRTSEAVESFETHRGRVTAVVTDRGTIPADLVILGIGMRPASDLARAAGLEVGTTGGIVTDRRQRTSVKGIWAAGDCVETFHRVSRRPVAIALGTHANKQGRVVGMNIGGEYAAFQGVVGTAVSKICQYEVARTGLTESEAEDAGFEWVARRIESTSRAGYYPDAGRVVTKVVAEQRTGRLLGAQIVGHEGAAKRIDVMATALWNEMTVGEIAAMDLAYAPPFSPVWDPVLIAARKADEAVRDTSGGAMMRGDGGR